MSEGKRPRWVVTHEEFPPQHSLLNGKGCGTVSTTLQGSNPLRGFPMVRQTVPSIPLSGGRGPGGSYLTDARNVKQMSNPPGLQSKLNIKSTLNTWEENQKPCFG